MACFGPKNTPLSHDMSLRRMLCQHLSDPHKISLLIHVQSEFPLREFISQEMFK